MTDAHQMHVSVIIPTYNGMNYLPLALESVLQQTYQDFEVIIVDNGSTDHTRQWAESLPDERVRYHYQENTGSPTGSRNTGIELAAGPIIAFLDCDDMWEPTKLEHQVRLLQPDDVGLVFCETQLMDGDGKLLGKKFDGTPCRGRVLPSLIRKNFICCSSVALKKRLLVDNGLKFLDGRPCAEDWDLWLRLAAICKFDFVDQCLLRYRSHGDNLSGNIDVIYQSRVTVLDDVLRREANNLDYGEQTYQLITEAYRHARADADLRYGHGLNLAGRKHEAKQVMLGVVKQRPTYAHGWWGLLKCWFNLGTLSSPTV